MRTATFSEMPQELKDAYLQVNPSQEGLLKMFKRDADRMNSFPDIPDSDIASIKATTLIIMGDRDVATAWHAAEMQSLIEGSRLMIVPGGHGDYIGEITTLKNGNNCYVEAIPFIERFLMDR